MSKRNRPWHDKPYPMTAVFLRRAAEDMAPHGKVPPYVIYRRVAAFLEPDDPHRGQVLIWHWLQRGVPQKDRKRLNTALWKVERRLTCWCCDSGRPYGQCCDKREGDEDATHHQGSDV